MAREVKLTKSGYERLVAELEQERIRLQEATRILQELMESSDDYDDSGMEDAKREKGRIEMRIESITDSLSRAEILEEDGSPVKVVSLGATIHLKAKDGEMDVQVVAPVEASVLERPMKISDESPMGKALMGQKVGAKVMLETPRGKKEFKIESVKH